MPRRRTTSSSSSTGSSPAPRNRTPQPVRVRRRSFGDFVKAFLAFVVLAGLVVGVPLALAVTVGWPFPDGAPGLDWLQREITVETFLRILTVIVWFAWAQFTACVLVEVKAALSGVGVPGRVPGAGPSQLLARQLVAALLLVGATAASLTPGLSQLGHGLEGNQKPSVAAAQQTPGLFAQQQEQAAATAGALAEQAGQAAARADGAAAAHGDTKYYRIQPPEGRHHDSLWEIADRHLGDGRRYHEIFELNKDRVQPDGSKLSEASLIRPGWIMEMPGDARGGELVEMPDEAPNVSEQVQQQIHDYASFPSTPTTSPVPAQPRCTSVARCHGSTPCFATLPTALPSWTPNHSSTASGPCSVRWKRLHSPPPGRGTSSITWRRNCEARGMTGPTDCPLASFTALVQSLKTTTS